MLRRAVFGSGILVLLTVALLGSPAQAQSLAPLVNPGNGHFYEAVTVSGGIDWFNARDAAELQSFMGVQGHLVTITSAQEYNFITTNFPEAFAPRPDPAPECGSGPTTDPSSCGDPYWLGGFQPAGSLDEPEGDWEWVTGEPFVYTNWADGNPNDSSGREEDCLNPHPTLTPKWNDSQCDDRRTGGYVVEYDVATFPDVQSDHWAWQFVEAIAAAGLTSGFPDGTYRPDNPVTRAEMAVFIKKGIHGSTYTPPTLDGSHPFSDIAGHWAEAWIEDLFDEGFTSGFPDGTYRPDNQVTRAEMAVFLKKAIHGSAYTSPPPDGSHPFSDIAGHWAEAWIEDLFDEGVTSGFPDGTYRPDNTATRAEMAVFLVNAFSLPLP
jgi:hypothetical protein